MQIDFLNPRSLICLFAILQGIVFAALLVMRGVRRRRSADLWLATLLLLLCSALITPMIGFANVYDLNQWLTYFPFSIMYSYGPCVWLYSLSLTDTERRFQRRDLTLFIPTFIYLAVRLTMFAQSLEWKDWFGDNYGRAFTGFVFITDFGWTLYFLWRSINHHRSYRRWLDENYADSERIRFDWLRTFLYVFGGVVVLGAGFDFIDSFVVKLSYIQIFYFEVVLALATYGLALAGYLRSGTTEPRFDPDDRPENEIPAAERDFAQLKPRIEKLMTHDQLFLEPNLTLTDVARRLGVNSAQISAAINGGFGKNFNDFINEHRIEEVKSRMLATESGDAGILALALDCGFNSKATFNRAFRKFTGQTPREFMKSRGKSTYV